MAFPGTNCLREIVCLVGQVAGEAPRPRVQVITWLSSVSWQLCSLGESG